MATIDLSALTGTSGDQYDDVTGQITLTIPVGLPNEESTILGLVETLETLAQNKRSNLDFPISEKAFPDDPIYSYVSRSDGATTPTTETQIERQFQFVGWYVAPTVTATNAVNDND